MKKKAQLGYCFEKSKSKKDLRTMKKGSTWMKIKETIYTKCFKTILVIN